MRAAKENLATSLREDRLDDAQSVNLGRFDGGSVLGQPFVDLIVERMKKEGLVPARMHVQVAGKADLKYVTYRSPDAPSPGKSGVFHQR